MKRIKSFRKSFVFKIFNLYFLLLALISIRHPRKSFSKRLSFPLVFFCYSLPILHFILLKANLSLQVSFKFNSLSLPSLFWPSLMIFCHQSVFVQKSFDYGDKQQIFARLDNFSHRTCTPEVLFFFFSFFAGRTMNERDDIILWRNRR